MIRKRSRLINNAFSESDNSLEGFTDNENVETNIEDFDDEEEGNNLSYIPEEEREVFIDRAQLSIFELHRRCKRGDIILQPHYQRKDVWTRPKKSKLIESILRSIPIPSIYFAETPDGRWEVVDGQQRLTAFFDFLDDGYPLLQLPVLSQFERKYFKDLEGYQRKIEDYQLHIFIIKKESHPDIRFDIFERINEGATQLNAQELRNSIYRGTRIKLLKKLSKNRNFVRVTKGKLQEKRLKHQEAVLRFISFYKKGFDNYNGNLNSFLNSTLEEHLLNENNIEDLVNVIDITMGTIYEVFQDNAFIKSDTKMKKINMSLFDVLSYSFAINIHERHKIIKNKKQIVNSLNNLIGEDTEFKRSITSNTLTRKNVNYRFNKWLIIFNEILSGDDCDD
jgi:hypothetical protein